MLVLSRKREDKIHIGDDITITVVVTKSDGSVRLGIEAPADKAIWRGELAAKFRAESPGSPLPPRSAAA